MKYLKFIIITVFFCGLNVYSQEKNKIITRGETLSDAGEITHEVLAKETLYGIAKQYGTTIANLYKANPILESSGLKIGQEINIPSKGLAVVSSARKEDVKPMNEIFVREVLPKETKYGIAKEYGITVHELERQNPSIVGNLPIGFKLTIQNPNPIVQNNPIKKEESVKPLNENTVFKNAKIPLNNSYLADQLIHTASENLGSRYQTGGITKSGFDCSGLMYATFGTFDIKLPRSSFEQSSYGTKINPEEAQKGDLIFFKTNGRGQINHVGMVVEVNSEEIKFIHSSVQSGVIISSTKEKYYENNFTQINRVLQ